MSKQTFNIHFILKTEKKNKKGLTPIYTRIRLNGMKMELTTNRKILQQDWSTETELALPTSKSLKDLNKFLEDFKVKIYSAYTSILSRGESITPNFLKEELFGLRVHKKHSLIETATEHNKQFEKLIGIKYSYGSYKNYKTTLKYLIEFVPLNYGKGDIGMEQIDYKFCENYFTFLTTQKSCTNNGANKQIQRVKKIVNYAIKSGYINSSAVNSYSLHFKPVKKVPLSIEEIYRLLNWDFQRETLKKVRDVFVFQCFTGLSYGDVKRLSKIHVHEDIKGDLWVKMEREKTEVAFSVPLLKPATKLLNEYFKICQGAGPLFHVLSNQKMNDNLKIIQEITCINKNLTTHLARHTFATTVTLNNNVPIETVSKMLGHTNIRTTQLYAKVMDVKIGADMEKLKEKLL